MSAETILAFFGPEKIFSVAFLFLIIGFIKAGWPWLTKYFDARLERDYEVKSEDLKERRETNREMVRIIGELREEMAGFRAVQEQILASLLRAFRINGIDKDDR